MGRQRRKKWQCTLILDKVSLVIYNIHWICLFSFKLSHLYFGDQRTICRGWFSFDIWDSRSKLRSSSLLASTFSCWALYRLSLIKFKTHCLTMTLEIPASTSMSLSVELCCLVSQLWGAWSGKVTLQTHDTWLCEFMEMEFHCRGRSYTEMGKDYT